MDKTNIPLLRTKLYRPPVLDSKIWLKVQGLEVSPFASDVVFTPGKVETSQLWEVRQKENPYEMC